MNVIILLSAHRCQRWKRAKSFTCNLFGNLIIQMIQCAASSHQSSSSHHLQSTLTRQCIANRNAVIFAHSERSAIWSALVFDVVLLSVAYFISPHSVSTPSTLSTLRLFALSPSPPSAIIPHKHVDCNNAG